VVLPIRGAPAALRTTNSTPRIENTTTMMNATGTQGGRYMPRMRRSVRLSVCWGIGCSR
jgi:hypothetical protein